MMPSWKREPNAGKLARSVLGGRVTGDGSLPLTHHYRTALELYNRDSSSQQVDIAISECASAFAACEQPVALVGIYTPEQITDSHQGFWKLLEQFGLCVKFWPCRDNFAYMGVQLIKPKPQLETAAARVVEVPVLAVAA
jgi:hypothetical protein